ncbi:MAG: 4Fe-4S dicluster domain-containing protein [candidate division Zixibacteria bacterium]
MARWGMVIDLDKCVGCGTCMASCRNENNVPVANKELAQSGRSIFWMDMLTITEGEYPNLKKRIMPRPCFHCGDPPCTKVCPVAATYKNDEGLVAQIYHRCIGCRYCVNGCPYNAKYFNWYPPEHRTDDKKYLNPDVSLRSKGVVEKCSFCAHRLIRAREKAAGENRELLEGDFTTACQDNCPSKAITFGDLDNPYSEVSRLSHSVRAFSLLEDLGTNPQVYYLTEGEKHGRFKI